MITFVIQALHSGGAEKQLLLTATGLAKSGVPCRIFTLAQPRRHERIERLVAEAESAGVIVDRPSPLAQRSGARWLIILLRLAWLRDEVLWTWGARADLLGKLASLVYRRVSLVCGLRFADKDYMANRAWLLRFRSGMVAGYISNSHFNCNLLEELVPGSTARCRVIYNAMSEGELEQLAVVQPPTLGRLRIVMLGNIKISHKGYDIMLLVAARLRERGTSVEFHVAGRPDQGKEFLARRAQLELDDMVHYHGEVNRPTDFLRTGNVFLLSSRVEGMPNALLEAMMLGLPCVVTRVGDLGRFGQDKVHFRLVEIEDVEGIVAAIEELRDNWAAACQMGAAARSLCQRELAPAQMVANTKAVLAELGVIPSRAAIRAGDSKPASANRGAGIAQ